MSSFMLVVEKPENWPLQTGGAKENGVDVVAARTYLTDPAIAARRGVKVFNLCRSYRYQSLGYYVSLLAEARGHKPLPSVTTIQDLKSRSLVRFISEELDREIQRSLADLVTGEFTLSIYFGKNLARRHKRLALQLFNLFPAPLLRAQLERDGEGHWHLRGLRPIAVQEIPEEHRDFVDWAAREYFAGRRPRRRTRTPMRFDLALLVDPKETPAPSNERALQRLEKAAAGLGLRPTRITRDDYGRLAEFDALFIRVTTQVDHYTYRFARRAAAEGLVVIDDPVSIVRCANKVYLAEILQRAKLPTPRTVVLHRDNLESALGELGLPAILKLPDGSFSRAVARADDRDAFSAKAREYLESSDLVIAQEFLPTEFDWRVGILDRQVLFAARYGMARGHWQIARRDGRGRVHYGAVTAVELDAVPPEVLDLATKATQLIGDGFYGVDLKEGRDAKGARRIVIIEINDNPNLDADCEDAILGDELYRRIMGVFLSRIEKTKEGKPA